MSFTRLPHEDEAQWLAQRREYVTASEIHTIATSPASWSRIRAEKETGERTFHGNAVTRWGHEREPEIARFVRVFVDSSIVPNDDLFVLDGTNLAATPDMVSDNLTDGCETIGELKTAGRQIIRPEWETDKHGQRIIHTMMPDGFPKPGYWSQVQYQLFVMGAEVCVFACEVREETEDGFAPGETRVMLIGPDKARQAELVDIAERFLAGCDPTDGVVTPDGLQNLVWDYLDAKERMEDAKGAIEEIVGTDPETYVLDGAKVIVTADGKSTRLDAKAMEKDHPDIAAHYMTTSTRKGSVKIQKDRPGKAAA